MKCRICHSTKHGEELIQPCACRGSIGYAHESCLLAWLMKQRTLKCEVCKKVFRCSKVYSEGTSPGIWMRAGFFSRIRLLFLVVRMMLLRLLRISGRMIFFVLAWLFCVPCFLRYISCRGNTSFFKDAVDQQGNPVGAFRMAMFAVVDPSFAWKHFDLESWVYNWAIGVGVTVVGLGTFCVALLWVEWCNGHLHMWPEVLTADIDAAHALQPAEVAEAVADENEDGGDANDEDATDAVDGDTEEDKPENSEDTQGSEKTPREAEGDVAPKKKSKAGDSSDSDEDHPQDVKPFTGFSPPAGGAAAPPTASNVHTLHDLNATHEMIEERDADRVFDIMAKRNMLGRSDDDLANDLAQQPVTLTEFFGLTGPLEYAIVFLPCFIFFTYCTDVTLIRGPSSVGAMLATHFQEGLAFAGVAAHTVAESAAGATENASFSSLLSIIGSMFEEFVRLLAVLCATVCGISPHAIHQTIFPSERSGAETYPSQTTFIATREYPSFIPTAMSWVLGLAVCGIILDKIGELKVLPRLVRKMHLFFAAWSRVFSGQVLTMIFIPVATGVFLPLMLSGYVSSFKALNHGLHPQWQDAPINRSSNISLTPIEAAYVRLPPLDIGLCSTNMSNAMQPHYGRSDTFKHPASPFEFFAALRIIWLHRQNKLIPSFHDDMEEGETTQQDVLRVVPVRPLFNTSACEAAQQQGQIANSTIQWAKTFENSTTAFLLYAVGSLASHVEIFSFSQYFFAVLAIGFIINLWVQTNVHELRCLMHVNVLYPMYLDRPEDHGLETVVKMTWRRLVFVVFRNSALVAAVLVLLVRPAFRFAEVLMPEFFPLIASASTVNMNPMSVNVVFVICNGIRVMDGLVADDEMRLGIFSLIGSLGKKYHHAVFKTIAGELDLHDYFRTGVAPSPLADLSFPLRVGLFAFIWWLGSVASVVVGVLLCGLTVPVLRAILSSVDVLGQSDYEAFQQHLNTTNTSSVSNFLVQPNEERLSSSITFMTALLTIEVIAVVLAAVKTIVGPLRRRLWSYFKAHDMSPSLWLKARTIESVFNVRLTLRVVSVSLTNNTRELRSARVMGTSDKLPWGVISSLFDRLKQCPDDDSNKLILLKAMESSMKGQPQMPAEFALLLSQELIPFVHDLLVKEGLASRNMLEACAAMITATLSTSAIAVYLGAVPTSLLFATRRSFLQTFVAEEQLFILVSVVIGVFLMFLDVSFFRVFYSKANAEWLRVAVGSPLTRCSFKGLWKHLLAPLATNKPWLGFHLLSFFCARVDHPTVVALLQQQTSITMLGCLVLYALVLKFVLKDKTPALGAPLPASVVVHLSSTVLPESPPETPQDNTGPDVPADTNVFNRVNNDSQPDTSATPPREPEAVADDVVPPPTTTYFETAPEPNEEEQLTMKMMEEMLEREIAELEATTNNAGEEAMSEMDTPYTPAEETPSASSPPPAAQPRSWFAVEWWRRVSSKIDGIISHFVDKAVEETHLVKVKLHNYS